MFADEKKSLTFAAVEKLGNHIEALLHDNDCVILPGFGGFIVHTSSAYYAEDEHLFFPPHRSVTFNGQLTMNDGLLTQRYMQDSQLNYVDASQRVELIIDRLRDQLAIEGAVELQGVGSLHQDYAGLITFDGDKDGMASPVLFGLDAIHICELSALTTKQPSKVITTDEQAINIHIGRRALHTVTTAAAAALLLIMSILPAGDGKQMDVASLGIVPEITAVSEPAITDYSSDKAVDATPSFETTSAEYEAPMANETAVEVAASTVAQSEAAAEPASDASTAAQVPARPTKTYHVIIGSLPSKRGADETLQKYISAGYSHCSILEGDDRVRISLESFTDKAEGEAYVTELRKQPDYANAWLLPVKNK